MQTEDIIVTGEAGVSIDHGSRSGEEEGDVFWQMEPIEISCLRVTKRMGFRGFWFYMLHNNSLEAQKKHRSGTIGATAA
jgi:hypothetical protein